MPHSEIDGQSNPDFVGHRLLMVEEQLSSRGIRDRAVLSAMSTVPRHQFVPSQLMSLAYMDRPLPIGHHQTISQPYIVAYMLEAAHLKPNQKILEIGTGSGYQTALLSQLVAEVYTIEIIPDLAKAAQKTLSQLGYENIHVKIGDGYRGWPQHSPYDAIIVTAAPAQIPAPLIEQLTTNGRIIIPIGFGYQELVVLSKTAEGLHQETMLPVQFVPMTGQTLQ